MLHPRDGIVDRRVATRRAAFKLAHVGDPLPHPEVRRAALHQQGRAQPFDGDDLRHPVRKDAGVLETDPSAHGMTDDRERVVVDGVRQGLDIKHELRHAVLPAHGPIAVAVAAEVGRVDGVAADQRSGDAVPVAGVVAAAVDQ